MITKYKILDHRDNEIDIVNTIEEANQYIETLKSTQPHIELRYESFEYISYSGTFSESDNWYNSNLLLIIARYIHRNPNEPFVSHADDNFVFIYFLSVLAQLALASGNKHN